MRENIGLFKAKRLDNGEEVQGYYWTNELGNHFIRVVKDKDGNFINAIDFEIDPETLCEFTGLTDNNGNKIWENNIVKHCAENKPALVEFVKGQFSIAKYGYWLQSSDCFEVIGNKFDNPELLEVESENN
ncbi:MAG: YopX family protein [Clostridia bacterium]|jgi:uncharacterized phage protein (TIGR01671 family)|nr:YopX family protein [Clostridia bacterium]MDD3397913.1 YopX family protein [Clostridia bacterium]